MRKQDKIFTVQNLAEKLKEAKSLVLIDYRGLTVEQTGQLRNLVKKAGGELTVVKNTLLKLALKDTENLELTGPTAIIIAYEDELAPLKKIAEFARSIGIPSFKSGIWEGKVLSKDEIETLSLLPEKNELINQLLNILTSPTARLVNLISKNPTKLILILKKMEGGEVIHG